MEIEKKANSISSKINFGYATSTLQEDLVSSNYTFEMVNDKLVVKSISDWTLWLNEGFNKKLTRYWRKRENKTPENFRKRIKKYFEKDFLELLTQFKRAGVDIELPNNDQHGFKKHYIPIDLDVIQEIIELAKADSSEDNYANIFIKALGEVLNNAIKANIDIVFFINQFALKTLHDNYDLDLVNSIINEFKSKLQSFIEVNEVETPTASVVFEILTAKDIDWWKKHIDKMIEQAEVYGDFCELKSIRISIEWAEIFPAENHFSTKAAEKYSQIIKYATEKNLEVILCLNHMSMPLWIAHGWSNKSVTFNFLTYVEQILNYLSDQGLIESIKKILIFNEPNTFLANSYINGIWPPFKVPGGSIVRAMSFLFESFKIFRLNVIENWLESYEVSLTSAFKNTWTSHIEAYEFIKKHYPQIQVSSSQIYPDFMTKRRFNPLYKVMVSQLSKVSFLWIKRIRARGKKLNKKFLDFYGLQLYGSFLISKNTMPSGRVQGIIDNVQIKNKHINGWIDDPAVFAIRLIDHSSMIIADAVHLKNFDHTTLPTISFTEFGNPTGAITGSAKAKRIIRQIEAAKGLIPVKIDLMLRWALIDNWEWDSGYGNWARFGDLNYDFSKKPADNYGGIRLILHDKRIVRAAKRLLKNLHSYRVLLENELKKHDNIEAMDSHKFVERYINNIKIFLKSKEDDMAE